MMRLQNDDVSIPARSLVPLLRGVLIADPLAAKARDLLLAWDFSVDADSPAAGIYEMWQRRLVANVRDIVVPDGGASALHGGGNGLSVKKIIGWLEAPDGRFGEQPAKGRDDLLARSLTEAVARTDEEARRPTWRTGTGGRMPYHHALIQPSAQRSGARRSSARISTSALFRAAATATRSTPRGAPTIKRRADR